MSAAPVGALVRIYYDGEPLAPGDALVTRTGRSYVVTSVRVQERGGHRGRQHLACLVASRQTRWAGRVHPLYWHPRSRR